jgi:hypothetical protein
LRSSRIKAEPVRASSNIPCFCTFIRFSPSFFLSFGFCPYPFSRSLVFLLCFGATTEEQKVPKNIEQTARAKVIRAKEKGEELISGPDGFD